MMDGIVAMTLMDSLVTMGRDAVNAVNDFVPSDDLDAQFHGWQSDGMRWLHLSPRTEKEISTTRELPFLGGGQMWDGVHGVDGVGLA